MSVLIHMYVRMYVLLHCSYECSGHEAKARERKEELEAQAKELQGSLEQFQGKQSIFPPLTFHAAVP